MVVDVGRDSEISPRGLGVAGPRACMEGSGRRKDAAPAWAPSEGTVFRPFVAGAGAAQPSPSGSGSGVAARISKLHGVKRKPVRLIFLLFAMFLPDHRIAVTIGISSSMLLNSACHVDIAFDWPSLPMLLLCSLLACLVNCS